MTIMILLIRTCDIWGGGQYDAPRTHGVHDGTDYVISANRPLCSHVTGVVTKIGKVYADDKYTYVEINKKHRFFYVKPVVHVGKVIRRNEILGFVQDLEFRYPSITNHVHYEVN